jgi:hypothetical protein
LSFVGAAGVSRYGARSTVVGDPPSGAPGHAGYTLAAFADSTRFARRTTAPLVASTSTSSSWRVFTATSTRQPRRAVGPTWKMTADTRASPALRGEPDVCAASCAARPRDTLARVPATWSLGSGEPMSSISRPRASSTARTPESIDGTPS